jgi:chaperonin cofactor prefoldin
MSTVQQDFKGMDARLAAWSNQQDELRQRMERLSRDTRTRIDTASKQAGEAATAAASRIESEVRGEVDGLRTRVTTLESSGQRAETRIASLQQELTQVRGELARQSDELAATRRQVDGNGAAAEREFSTLRNDQQRVGQNVASIQSGLAVERVNFEVAKGHSQELAPGISLGLTHTNISNRQVEGWMWVANDRRTIWLRKQGAMEPVVFYGLTDGKKRELVITQVAKGSVAGYLILPKNAGTFQSASSSAAADETGTAGEAAKTLSASGGSR